ncbi:MAG: HAMP domain-containing histidine kinase [Clostridia bacterium]|nr:HAMP domain-containing histidine kinase [Clostridia bacterium]
MLLIILTIFLGLTFIIMNIIDFKNEALHWYSGMVFFGILCSVAVYLREYVLPGFRTGHHMMSYDQLEYLVFYMLFTSAVFISYPGVMFALVYSQMFPAYKRTLALVFLIPSLIQWIFFPVNKHLGTVTFTITAMITAIYYLTGCFFLTYSFIKEKNFKIKQQRLISMILYIPAFFYLVMINYILPLFGIYDLWMLNFFVIINIILFVIFASKYGVMGVRLRVEKDMFNHTFKMMTSGFLNHTLKNEINKVAIFAENIKHQTNPYEIEESVRIILDSTTQMKEMIGRIDQQIQEIYLKEAPYCLNEIVDHAVESILAYAGEKQIEIHKSYQRSILLECDQVHITEVITNVLKNAVEAIEDSGRVDINIYRNKGYEILEIKDTGCGVSKENLSRMVEPFWSTKGSIANTGLGLTYCYKIMQYYGSLAIHSEPNKGTSVFLNFSRKKIISGTPIFLSNLTHSHLKL